MIRSIACHGLAVLALSGVLAGCDSGAEDAVQESAANTQASTPASPPQLPGQIVRAFAGTELPDLMFEDPQGRTLNLGEIDRPVLVNSWATWCVPCRVEMPSLDRLAAEMGDDLYVLTISQNIRGAELVEPFFAKQDFVHLEPWLDEQATLNRAINPSGIMPLTILFDAEGREVLRVAGGYEWDSEEAIAQVKEALAAGDGQS